VLDDHGPAAARVLARGIIVALRSLYAVTGPVSYNVVVHLVEHPHAHVTPRSARHSGYELAGMSTCYVQPAVANERLAEAAESVLDTMSESCRSDAA
jgi:hypothetical protein